MQVVLNYSEESLRAGREDWEEVLLRSLAQAADVHAIDPEAELGVTLCDNAYIHELNRDYRQIDRPTDVLSFALNEGEEDGPEADLLLGDIVISVDKVREQAAEFGHSEERELAYLAVHGFLHIIGYDHMEPEDKAEMRAAEEEILGALGITREDIHGDE